MKSLGTLLIAAVIALLLGTVGAFAMVSSIDGSPRNSDQTAAEQAAEQAKKDAGFLEPEVYGDN